MLIFLLSFCCWFVLVFLILMNEPDFAEHDAIRVLNGPSLRMLKAQLKQQPTLTSSRERIMSFETHLNITMLQHEHVGGMWKVFRVISYHIFQNTPACYIHFLAFPDYFICSSLLPLFTCFSTTMADEQIPFIWRQFKVIIPHFVQLMNSDMSTGRLLVLGEKKEAISVT